MIHSNKNANTANPIKNDPVLKKLLAKTQGLKNEEAFSGWRETFLKEYARFLDEAGVHNAHMAEAQLVKFLKELSKSVISVNDHVQKGTVSEAKVSVMGQRSLINMTDQMANTEKALAKFIPSTSQDEEKMGYNKFELGAVLIQDGFQVYEILKGTRDIILQLQATILKDIHMSRENTSIIEFYLRQIQSFCDVMADLGLFGLMQQVMDIYAIMPRGTKSVAAEPIMPPKTATPPTPKSLKKKKEPVVEEPKKKQTTARATFDNGYKDPFGNASSQPKQKEEAVKGDPDAGEGEGEGVDDDSKQEIIYFDIKTGTIGRISRSKCRENSIIVTQDDEGHEQLDGGVDDAEEKEQLIWLLKKGMKQKNGQTITAKNMPPKSPPGKKARPAAPRSTTSFSSSKSPQKTGPKKPTVTPALIEKTGTYEQRLQKEMERCRPLKLSELKMELKSNHVSTIGFCKKSEFVHALAQACAI